MTDVQVMPESFLQSLAAGLLVGAIDGLMCVGLATILGIMRVIDFARGDFVRPPSIRRTLRSRSGSGRTADAPGERGGRGISRPERDR